MKARICSWILLLALLLSAAALGETLSADVDAPVEAVELFLEGEAAAEYEGSNDAAFAAESMKNIKITLGVKEKFTWKPDSSGMKLAFASKNSKICKVSQSGVITPLRKGKTTITVVREDGKDTATCTVTVKKAPTKVSLPADKVVLALGETRALHASLSSGTAGQVAYSSSATSVAVVDDKGNVMAVGHGQATITATAYNGKKDTCKVAVLSGPSPDSLKLNLTAAALALGQKFTLKPIIDEGCDAVYTFSSSDKKVATVNKDGMVSGKSLGNCTITVRTLNGHKATCKVKVCKQPTSIALNATKGTLHVGESYQLTFTLPKGSYSIVTFSSSDKKVATVSSKGVITAVGKGKTTITARTSNGKKATCKVTVKEAGAD